MATARSFSINDGGGVPTFIAGPGSINAHHAPAPPVDVADEEDGSKDPQSATAFGHKTIGFFGGIALLANNITGPGMVQIANVYEAAGWLTPTLVMLLIMVISTFAATLMTEAMAWIPGNENFERRVELTSLAKRCFSRRGFMFTVFLFILSLQAGNISSIIVSAQTMDFAFVRMGATCALEVYPHFRFMCVHEPGDDITPFGDAYVVSLGFIVLLIVTIPLGYFNLDDNVIVQKGAFIALLVIMVEWLVAFCIIGVDFSRVPLSTTNQSTVLGTIIFNYAFVVTVPSWVNEKKVETSVNKSVWGSSVLSTLLFLLVGLVGAWVFNFKNNEDILNALNDSLQLPPWLHYISQVCVYFFPIVVLVSGIPVMSIIIRYNLLENRFCNKVWANFWAVVFPWIVAVPFYTGSGLSAVIAWTGLFVNGIINFVIPLLMYIEVRRQHLHHHTADEHARLMARHEHDEGYEHHDEDFEPPFHAVPKWMGIKPLRLAYILIGLTVVLIGGCIVLDMVYLGLGQNLVS